MKITRILFLLLVLFLGCDDEDELKVPEPEPEPVTIFSLAIDTDYSLSKEDYWVMVHDKNGVLLDHEQITTGGQIEFETSATVPDGKIGITIFTYEVIGGISTSILDSYLAVPIGQVWKWKTPVTPPGVGPGTLVGDFTASYTLPTLLRMDLFGNNTTLGGFMPSENGNTKSYFGHIYESNRDFLLTIAGDGNPRYKFFENVKPGDHFVVTFDDMQEYDKVLDISFPATTNPYVSVYSLDEAGKAGYYTYYNGFNLPPFAVSMTLTNLKIGYLNRFEKYRTSIQIPSPNFGFGFEKAGSAPSPISFPDHAPYKLTDKSFLNFSYTQEIPFSQRRSTFKDNPTANKAIWWVVHAPEGNSKIAELPDGFLESYPFINLANLKHSSTSFLNSTITWARYLDLTSNRMQESNEFETTTVTLQ